MTGPALKQLILATFCVCAVVAAPASVGANPLSIPDRLFLQSLEELERRQLTRRAAAVDCMQYFDATEDVDNLRQVMVGFLEVPKSEAMAAFCEALVEAIASRRLPLAPIRDVMADESVASSTAAMGVILRQVFYAHRRGDSLMTERRRLP